ncbi:MAG TPA: hypothetical protein PLE74_01405 [Candidatus Cloacimonadota bacterium]|nr:hypothetical protein [Candidatus Cloacimonadota bacterium]HPT70921.1 hypothetical protein [Candidatus Cloacimonadota bacterium]
MKRFFYPLIAVIPLMLLTSCFFGPSLLFFDRDADGKPNLIPDGDFEIAHQTGNQTPNSWMFLSNFDYRNAISWDSLFVQNGKKSLMIKYPEQKVLLVSESFPIDNRSAYLNRCFVRSKYPSITPVVMYFRTFDKIGARKDNFTSKLKSNSTWNEILLSTGFFKPNAQFARVIISIPMDKDNIYWIDNIGSYHVHTFTR